MAVITFWPYSNLTMIREVWLLKLDRYLISVYTFEELLFNQLSKSDPTYSCRSTCVLYKHFLSLCNRTYLRKARKAALRSVRTKTSQESQGSSELLFFNTILSRNFKWRAHLFFMIYCKNKD